MAFFGRKKSALREPKVAKQISYGPENYRCPDCKGPLVEVGPELLACTLCR